MAIKQRPDSPTNNFATWNELDTTATLSDGNLKVVTGNVKTFSNIFLPKSNGKYYVEYYVESMGYPFFGVYNHDTGTHSVFYSTTQTNESIKIKSVNTANTFTVTNGDIVSVLVDTTNETIQWFKNGGSPTSSYTLDDLSDNDYSFYTLHASGAGGSTIRINFGQDPTFGGNKTPSGGTNSDDSYPDKSTSGIGGFFYDPPADAKALCTANLPEMTPTVDDDVPKDYFNTFLYDASGSSVQQFAHGFTFTPDFLWIKNRSSSSGSHWIYDRVRGFTDYDLTAGKGLSSASSAAEGGDVTLGAIIEPRPTETYDIDTHITIRDGNSAGVDTYNVNYPGHKYVVWGFRAGGAPTADNTATSGAMNANGSAATSSNSSVSLNGTLQSNYTPAGSPTIYPKRMSINTKAGFSIVSWSGNNTAGATYSHGLSQAPELVITKCTNASVAWITYSSAVDSTGYLSLSDEFQTSRNSWFTNNTPPSTSLISNGYNSGTHNDSAHNYITYCWHSVEGYSKFGSFTGNNSADGPFVYCGFRPAWVMVKSTNLASSSWFIWDSKRSPNNEMKDALLANDSLDELHDREIDFLSNGFKPRASDGNYNGNYTYIFMAFAEQPFNYATAR